MSRPHPKWLQQLLSRPLVPPKLFAWNVDNITLSSNPIRNTITRTAQSDPASLRIYVVGAGNLGRLFASSLAKQQPRPPITLVVSSREQLTNWASNPGIEITREDRVEVDSSFDVEWWADKPPSEGPVLEIAAGGRIRNLIIATKASAALPEFDRLRGYIDGESTVAFAQNGVNKLWPPEGSHLMSARFDECGQGVGTPNCLAIVTTHGVTSRGPFRSIHASPGSVVMGPVLLNKSTASRVSYLTNQLITAPYINGRSVGGPELWIMQLEKVVVNSVINPLTAILNCRNGDLFTTTEGSLPKIIDALLGECSAVLTGLVTSDEGQSIVNNIDPRGAIVSSIDLSREALLSRFSAKQLRSLVYRVGHDVRDNISSMLQDVRNGKKTEIYDFNGWFIDTAARLGQGMETPCHEALVQLVNSGKFATVDELALHFEAVIGRVASPSP